MYALKICIFEKGSRRILWSVRFSSGSLKDALNVQSDHWNRHFVLCQRHVSKLFVLRESARSQLAGTIHC